MLESLQVHALRSRDNVQANAVVIDSCTHVGPPLVSILDVYSVSQPSSSHEFLCSHLKMAELPR